MATALTYIHAAEKLLKEATEPFVNEDYARRQIAAAAVYADLAQASVNRDRLALADARLIGEAMAPDHDPQACTCSPRGAETHQIGCPDTPDEDN